MTEPWPTVRYPPAEALLALYRRRGPVINYGVGRHGYSYLLGAEANKFVFANSDAFSWREAFEALVPVDGPTALIVSDGAEHRRRRNLVLPALHHRQVQRYVQAMAANADAVIDGWQPGQTFNVYDQFRAAIRRATMESLFGPRMAGQADFLGEQLQPLMNLTHRLPQVMAWQRRAHTPGWRRAMAGRARVEQWVDTEIARARDSGSDEHVLACWSMAAPRTGSASATPRSATR